MADEVYLAVDLGASSGRVLAGILDGRRLRLDEVHRFENGAVAAAGGLFWNVLGLWSHILDGLRGKLEIRCADQKRRRRYLGR